MNFGANIKTFYKLIKNLYVKTCNSKDYTFSQIGYSVTIHTRSPIGLTVLEGVEGGMALLGGLHARPQEVQADVNGGVRPGGREGCFGSLRAPPLLHWLHRLQLKRTSHVL